MLQAKKEELLVGLKAFKPTAKNELDSTLTSLLIQRQEDILKLTLLVQEYFKDSDIEAIREEVLTEAHVVKTKGELFKEKIKNASNKDHVDDEEKQQIISLEKSIENMTRLTKLQDEYEAVVNANDLVMAEAEYIFGLLKQRENLESPSETEITSKASGLSAAKNSWGGKDKSAKLKLSLFTKRLITLSNIFIAMMAVFTAYELHRLLKKPIELHVQIGLGLTLISGLVGIFAINFIKNMLIESDREAK
ncbi:MAG: hypothetical protein VYA60_04665 [Pseudomonadota bacterium]|nr:hypothetical protein [Pseudomonadota bacterium]